MRRLHVLEDLKPYQCLEDDCPAAETTYSQLKALRKHYEEMHSSARIMLASKYTCLFCEDTLPASIGTRLKHIGRHLEESSFSVLPRQQEDWQFYSDSASKSEVLSSSIVP